MIKSTNFSLTICRVMPIMSREVQLSLESPPFEKIAIRDNKKLIRSFRVPDWIWTHLLSGHDLMDDFLYPAKN